jgi:hypothetical protein
LWEQNAATSRNALPHCEGSAVPIHSLLQPGVFDPEAIVAMSEALDAACQSQPEAMREVIAQRIISAATFGERDPARLREAALGRPRSERD